MTDKQQRARDLLAAEFRRDGLDQVADSILSGHAIPNDARSLRAIVAALPDEQPARGEVRENLAKLVEAIRVAPGVTGGGVIAHIAAAVRDPRVFDVRLLAPPAGPAVEELLADMRERAAKVAECSYDDRPCSRIGHHSQMDWDDGYREGTQAAATAIRITSLTTRSYNA